MIEVENVSKLFGNFRAVDGISFSIQTGEIVGLLGPNGLPDFTLSLSEETKAVLTEDDIATITAKGYIIA